ncbi:MAG: radical SAM protein [Nitrospirota bacterium]
MKIKFIYPKFDKFLDTYPELAEMPAISAIWSFRMPPALGIPIMVGLTPDNIEWHVEDQNIEEINFEDDSDLIAVSYFTPQAGYAYEIGDEFMRRGKTVIAGGMHPSMMPEEASKHCNSICIGEVDTLWQNIIEDFKNGQLKPVYKACNLPAPDEIKSPKKSIFDSEKFKKYEWHASLVSVARGCSYNCSWCNIPIYQGKEIRFRPVDIVAEEIRKLSGKEFYITEDVIMLNRENSHKYLMELCDRVKDYNVSMFLSGSPAINSDPKFFDVLAQAGTKNIYMVFAGDKIHGFYTISKMFYMGNKLIWDKCIDLVKTIEDRGIRFFASFSLGFDFAGEGQFDLILEFCERAKVKTAEFFIATPFPNTPFWHQLREENRLILPIDWKKYNCANVVFKPNLITEEKLLDGFLYLWKEFYKNADYNEYLSTFPTLHQKAKNILKSDKSERFLDVSS